MASNYVFLVHGMGQHFKVWSAAWKACLEENAKRFAPYSGGSKALGDDVEFVEVTYVGLAYGLTLHAGSTSSENQLPHLNLGLLWHEGRRGRDGVLLSVGVDVLELLSN